MLHIMEKFLISYEKYISGALVVLAMVGVAYLTIELAVEFGLVLYRSITSSEHSVDGRNEHIVGMFFTILLWLEILQSVKVFAQDHAVKLRIIIVIGMIAVTRKVLMMDIMEATPIAELSTAGLILSLSIAYFLVTRPSKKETDHDASES